MVLIDYYIFDSFNEYLTEKNINVKDFLTQQNIVLDRIDFSKVDTDKIKSDLEDVDMESNKIINLEAIKGFSNFTKILPEVIKNNMIFIVKESTVNKMEDIPYLPNNEMFEISNNYYHLDFTGMKSFPNVKEMYFTFNNIINIKNFSEYTPNLKKLDMNNSKLYSLKGFPKKMDKLEDLNLNNTLLENLIGFPKSPNLKNLDLSYSMIKSLKGIKKTNNLKELNLKKTRISNLKGLNNLQNMEVLNLDLERERYLSLEGLDKINDKVYIDFGSTKILGIDHLNYNNYKNVLRHIRSKNVPTENYHLIYGSHKYKHFRDCVNSVEKNNNMDDF